MIGYFIDILPPHERWVRGVKNRRINVAHVAAYDIRECEGNVVIDLYTTIEDAIDNNAVRTLAGFEVPAFLNAVGASTEQKEQP